MPAVDLTDEELLERCRELREVLQELTDEEAEQKRQKDTLKGRMAEITTRYRALLQIVKTGRLEKEMRIRMIYNLDRRQVSHVREDTGTELAGRRRPMTDSEYASEKAKQAQAELPLETPPPTPMTPADGLPGTELAPLSGPLLVSCEVCGHGKGDHRGEEHEGPCLVMSCVCTGYVAFGPPSEEQMEEITRAEADSGGDPDPEPEHTEGGLCGNCEAALPSYQAPGSLCPRCETEGVGARS